MEAMGDDMKEISLEIQDIVSKCVKCRFCFTECPIYEVSDQWMIHGSSGITQALYHALRFDRINEDLRDILMRCTTCGSCESICERVMAGVKLVDAVRAGRRLLMEREVPLIRQQQKALEHLQIVGNPYGKSPSKRTLWAEESNLKRVDSQNGIATLYYVGCASSYDERLQNVARSIAAILQRAGVEFGILENEKNSGDFALQMGESGLFEMLRDENTEKFNQAGAKTIVTTSPHDFDCFLKAYSDDLKDTTIKHYTQYLAELMDRDMISFNKHVNKKVTFHDPCYLSKHNDLTDAAREVLRRIPGVDFVEMERTGKNSFCCGGGGGRMWAEFEENPRLSEVRVLEALDTGAEILVTACPFCLANLEDAAKVLNKENEISIQDVSEIVSQAMDI